MDGVELGHEISPSPAFFYVGGLPAGLFELGTGCDARFWPNCGAPFGSTSPSVVGQFAAQTSWYVVRMSQYRDGSWCNCFATPSFGKGRVASYTTAVILEGWRKSLRCILWATVCPFVVLEIFLWGASQIARTSISGDRQGSTAGRSRDDVLGRDVISRSEDQRAGGGNRSVTVRHKPPHTVLPAAT